MKINNNGFSLVEMLVVTAIFTMVIVLTSEAFLVIQRNMNTQSRLAQSNIDGVIGLEILRSDLEAAGYGLFWNLPTDATGNAIAIKYNEADNQDPEQAYNLTGAAPPFAVQSGNDTTQSDSSLQLLGTDYLVLRGTSLAHNLTSQRWSYMKRRMTFSDSMDEAPSGYSMALNYWANNNLTATDNVVVVTGTDDKDPANHRKLIMNKMNNSFFCTQFSQTNLENFQPPPPTMPPIPHALTFDSTAYYIYGVNGSADSGALRMPYNRADYYVRRPSNATANKMSQRCASNTGILFKGVVSHASGVLFEYPLLDCVADFQVVYTLDPNNNGFLVETSANGLSQLGLSAEDIRNQLKSIQVYILTHDGKKDTNYTFPNDTIGVGPGNGLTSGSGHKFDLSSAELKNYRWKVYRITVTPKNLLPPQK